MLRCEVEILFIIILTLIKKANVAYIFVMFN